MAFLAAPEPPPALHIPPSLSTVDVRVIDSTCRIRGDLSMFFTDPVEQGATLDSPAYVFLVSHAPSRAHYLFDLGLRRDFDNFAPEAQESVGMFEVQCARSVPEILRADTSSLDVRPEDVTGVIWSHHHWDHIGNMSEFPPGTEVVVGPGFKAAHLPTYPTDPEGELQECDVAGREVREVDMADAARGRLRLGRCDAYDFFGDGSFYLLSTPGHTVGHLSGLARTTAGPDSGSTFILMGGDVCSDGGELRPTAYLPLPARIEPSPSARFRGWCPGEALRAIHPRRSATKPFFESSPDMNEEPDVARATLEGVTEFDAADNVFTILAHDQSLLDKLVYFPEKINDWKARGIKEQTRWAWAGLLKNSLVPP